MKCLDAKKVIEPILSGHRVFVHGASSTPTVLLQALVDKSEKFHDVEFIHLHTQGFLDYAYPNYEKNFRVANLFVGTEMRSLLDMNRVDYLPCFLSEIPLLFRSRRRPIHVALLHLSPPDRHGYCTFGTSVDIVRAAVDVADIVLAQINRQMPRVHGDTFIHLDQINRFIEVDVPLPTLPQRLPTSQEKAIGKNVANIVEDGSCLQVGIGSVPDAILGELEHHKNLGVHSELWSDGILKLIEKGVVDNSRKSVHKGKTVSGFIVGSKAVYDFIDDNPSVIQLGIEYVNNPAIIARNSNVCAINSAVEVDLTGQVCADSIGHKIISGVGGQMDFIRGAALSPGGKPIVAFTSRTKTGSSRIVPTLKPGAGVVTTRAHVHYIATEYGVADLFGKTLSERARALIQISHPDDRENLERAWGEIQTR